jgi:hypothetical protein
MVTTVLTVSALDLGIDRTVNYMKRVCNGFAVSKGNVQVQVKYPASLDPSAGDNPHGSIASGARKLNAAIRATKGPKVVLGYSQGAQVVGTWLRNYANKPDAPDPKELSFILIGNPERRFGKQPWTKKTTPDDTQYHVRDVTRQGDNWADYNPKTHSTNKIAALFGSVHTNYWRVNIYDPSADTVEVVGNTEYVRVR